MATRVLMRDNTPTIELKCSRLGPIRLRALAEKYPTVGDLARETDHRLGLVPDIGPGLVKKIRKLIAEGKC